MTTVQCGPGRAFARGTVAGPPHDSPVISLREGLHSSEGGQVCARVVRVVEGVGMSPSLRRWGRVSALLFVVILVASACSKSDDSSGGGASTPTATIFVQNFKYNGVPASLTSGIHEFLFQNKESFPITHEMIPIALPAGKTAQDVINGAKTNGPSDEDNWLHIGGDFGPADTGAGVVEFLNLPPGNYAFACWQTGTQSGGENGPPHASIGMVAQFTVT
jgi:hypothetical protein